MSILPLRPGIIDFLVILHHDALMKRITISLDDELYRIAKAYALSEDISLSKAVVRLMRRGMEGGNGGRMQEEPTPYQYTDPRTGLLVTRIGRAITTEDVQSALDEEDHRHLEMLSGEGP